MSLSLREMTVQQFAEGTTIDGVRVDRAVGDFVSLWNAMPKRMIDGIHVENRLAGGYMPHSTYVLDRLPWMNAFNSTAANSIRSGGAPPASAGTANPWRAKGFETAGIDLKDTADPADQTVLFMTQNLWFSTPTILNGVWLCLGTDSVYLNDFLYGASPPPGKSNGQMVDDLFIEVSVRNAFLSGVRRLDDVEVHKVRFAALSHRLTMFDYSGVVDTGLPPHPEGVLGRSFGAGPASRASWVVVDLRHLNIPLPARSYLRFSVGIPLYDTYDSGWGNSVPQSRQYHTWALDVLEEIL